MKTQLGIFGILVLALGMIASPLAASAQTYQQVISTDKGTLKVGISTDPATPKSGDQSKLKIDFLNPKTSAIQEHIDYTVSVTNGGSAIFGPIPLTHTSIGTATIPIQFKDGDNKVVIDIQGILFQPIPSEKASFSITLGDKQAKPKEEPKTSDKATTSSDSNKNTKPTTVPISDKNKSKDGTKSANTVKVNVEKKNVTKDSKKDTKSTKKDSKKDTPKRVIKAPKLVKPKPS